jgi:hypothetical protein
MFTNRQGVMPVGFGVAVGQVLCCGELGEGVGVAAPVPGAFLGGEGLELGIVAGQRGCPERRRFSAAVQ